MAEELEAGYISGVQNLGMRCSARCRTGVSLRRVETHASVSVLDVNYPPPEASFCRTLLTQRGVPLLPLQNPVGTLCMFFFFNRAGAATHESRSYRRTPRRPALPREEGSLPRSLSPPLACPS